ncbi:MAG: hypothetical protein NC390_08355 [Fusobacterium sp.]|nr:hypothetical protein [Fusobacterium sp.]
MGLSASQARLLSITQRLSNNELQSEIMANNKIRLSEANVTARDKYIASLDSTKMDYISYDDSGIQETVALTFNSMSQYTPLKNQYNLYNTEGQILVSPTDAANFQKSGTLYEFLDCYGLFDRGAGEYQKTLEEFQKEMDAYNEKQAEYEDKLNAFKQEFGEYQAKLDEYNAKLKEHLDAQQRYEDELKAYQDALNAPKLYSEFTNAVVGNSHYTAAKNNDPGCFLHVLNNLIDYTGSQGGTRAPYATSAKNPDGSSILLTSSEFFENNNYNMPELQNTSTYMSSKEDMYLCDGEDVGSVNGKNLYEMDREAGRQPSVYTQLASDFIEIRNSDGTFSYKQKTLKQKTIDMYYLLANSVEQKDSRGSGSGEFTITNGSVTVASLLTNFVEGDMKGLDPKEPTPPEPIDDFTDTPPQLNAAPPDAPVKPTYTQKLYDQPLAQWYINLWNAMEGSDKSDKLHSIGDEEANFDYYTVPDKERTSTFDANGKQVNRHYEIIDQNLASDSDWLQFAITNGIVTMRQAALRFNGDITWEGIEFSSTSDIREVEDSSKIAKAEAEYQKSMYEIQAQDKEYDIKIKKLDTEHSALLQEVESIKNVMSKNVEKSFAAFS